MSSDSVELGFLEKRASWKLRSKFFPSKLGGSPAWLCLKNLPNRSHLLCKTCDNPLLFLLQVYAPVFDTPSGFHRTLFLFMCGNDRCQKRFSNETFVVYRNQLARENEFYSFEPPVMNEKSASEPSAEKYHPVCCICGFAATIKCSKCSEIDYCCEDHLECDWRWNHQNVCGKDTKDIGAKHKKPTNNFLLPEFELVTETEQLPASEPEKSDEEKMEEYKEFMQSAKAPKELLDVPLDDFAEVMKRNDKAFNKFQKRTKLEPEQVLRYQRGGAPLWVSAEYVPSPEDIPDCSCGAKRIFEFQVMPQLLNHLPFDTVQGSVDWGTLAVYTCSKSCEAGVENYVEEFIWKQDFSDEHC